jgi:hypothetical protein
MAPRRTPFLYYVAAVEALAYWQGLRRGLRELAAGGLQIPAVRVDRAFNPLVPLVRNYSYLTAADILSCERTAGAVLRQLDVPVAPKAFHALQPREILALRRLRRKALRAGMLQREARALLQKLPLRAAGSCSEGRIARRDVHLYLNARALSEAQGAVLAALPRMEVN